MVWEEKWEAINKTYKGIDLENTVETMTINILLVTFLHGLSRTCRNHFREGQLGFCSWSGYLHGRQVLTGLYYPHSWKNVQEDRGQGGMKRGLDRKGYKRHRSCKMGTVIMLAYLICVLITAVSPIFLSCIFLLKPSSTTSLCSHLMCVYDLKV